MTTAELSTVTKARLVFTGLDRREKRHEATGRVARATLPRTDYRKIPGRCMQFVHRPVPSGFKLLNTEKTELIRLPRRSAAPRNDKRTLCTK